jgi:hypothetical protein
MQHDAAHEALADKLLEGAQSTEVRLTRRGRLALNSTPSICPLASSLTMSTSLRSALRKANSRARA